jgi:hypothetical protein
MGNWSRNWRAEVSASFKVKNSNFKTISRMSKSGILKLKTGSGKNLILKIISTHG